MSGIVEEIGREFRRTHELASKALAGVDDAAFFAAPAGPGRVNPIALIVKHLAGNLRSRWRDFPEADGEKPDRDRDGEFVLGPADTREALMRSWDLGWSTLFATLDRLADADLGRTTAIRGEPHTVLQALLRGSNHAAYHVGQILYLARLLCPDSPWLTVAPGASRGLAGGYLAAGPADRPGPDAGHA